MHDCRLGLIYHRDNPVMSGALARLRRVFTGNFSFLGLTKSTCASAIVVEQRDQQIAAAQRELQTPEAKLARKLKRTRERLAPKGSIRNWLLKRSVGTVKTVHSLGLIGLMLLLVRPFKTVLFGRRSKSVGS
jgi:hypothetical protein